MPDPRTSLLLLLSLAGVVGLVWLVRPALRGRAAALRDVGTHRLALASVAVVFVANSLLTLPIAPSLRISGLTVETFAVAALATQAPMLLVPYLRLVVPRALSWRDLGLVPQPAGSVLRAGLLAGLAAIGLAAALGAAFEQLGVRQNQLEGQFGFVRQADTVAFIVVLFQGAVAAPFVEEIFFRGFLFGLYRRRKPLWMAYLASGLLFALPHASPQVGDVLQNAALLASIFALGSLLSWTYQRTGSLYPAMVAHSLNNGLALTALYASGRP